MICLHCDVDPEFPIKITITGPAGCRKMTLLQLVVDMLPVDRVAWYREDTSEPIIRCRFFEGGKQP